MTTQLSNIAVIYLLIKDSIFGGSPANFDESTRAAGMPSPPLKESRKETELQQGEEQGKTTTRKVDCKNAIYPRHI